MTKEIIRNMGFLLGSPNCCPPLLNVSLSPLAGVSWRRDPNWILGVTGVSDRPWSCKELEPSGPGATGTWCGHLCLCHLGLKLCHRDTRQRMVSVQSQACAQATEVGGRQNAWVNV